MEIQTVIEILSEAFLAGIIGIAGVIIAIILFILFTSVRFYSQTRDK